MKNKIVCILLCLYSTSSIAEFSFSKFENISISFGNWLEHYGQVQTSKNSDDGELSFTPYFSTGIQYEINQFSSFASEVGYIIQRDAGDSEITKDQFFVRADYIYKFQKKYQLRAGSSFMILSISSDGGSETLANGNGTEKYYRPTERRTIINQTLDLGVEAIFDHYTARLTSYIYSPFNDEERIYSLSLSVSYLLKQEDI